MGCIECPISMFHKFANVFFFVLFSLLFLHFIFFPSSTQLTAFENYLRLCTPQDSPSWFNRSNTTIILLTVWVVAFVASGIQYVSNVGFDFCNRQWNGLVPYQMAIVAILIIVPIIITFYTHMRIILDVKRFMNTPNFKPSLNYTWDLSLARTNFYSFIIFVAFWLPFGIVLSYHTTATVTKRAFYTTAWIGFIKSCFHNVIYCITNTKFRNAYVNLFHYCCCKTTVSVSRRQRNDACRPTSDVRVHIIPGYNMYSYTSPQRSGNCHNYWSKRDVHEL